MESNVTRIRERGRAAGMAGGAGPALPTRGTCLLVAGATSSGKSTVLRGLIHQLFTDETIRLQFRDDEGEAIEDPVLQEWILEHDRGLFPKGTPLGRLQSYFIEFGQGRRPMSLSLCDMAGEDYQAILPQSGGAHGDTALDDSVEHILTSTGVKKLFIFTADATRKGQESPDDHMQPLYEDLLFSALLARIHTLGVRRIRILFVATKWDAITQKNQSARAFFKRKLPQTRSRLKQFARANVQYVRYSVGQVAADAEGQLRIVRHDTLPVRRLAQWIHLHGTGRSLKDYPPHAPDPVGLAQGAGGVVRGDLPLLFVCGPVSDLVGFEHKVLGKGDTRASESRYRAAIRSVDTVRPEVRQRIHRLTQKQGVCVYAELRGIRPNDTGNNRNAYIGVGFVYEQGPMWGLESGSKWLNQIENLHENLRIYQEPDTGRFPPGFRVGRSGAEGLKRSSPEGGPRHAALTEAEQKALLHLIANCKGEMRLGTAELVAAAEECPEQRWQEQAEAIRPAPSRANQARVRYRRRAAVTSTDTAGWLTLLPIVRRRRQHRAAVTSTDTAGRPTLLQIMFWIAVGAVGGALITILILLVTGYLGGASRTCPCPEAPAEVEAEVEAGKKETEDGGPRK